MRMGEVAEKAGVSIGRCTIFPDKAAIIRHPGRALQRRGPRLHRRRAADVARHGGLRDASAAVDIYYGLFLAEPVMRDIWSGTQADKGLRDIDLEDSRSTGRAGRGAGPPAAPRPAAPRSPPAPSW